MSENPTGDAGSEEFVRELTNHQSSMLGYIRSLAPGGSGARDLLQEVNITLWQKRDSFELGTNFKAWAFQTIRYHILNHRRRLVSQGWLVFDDDLIERMSPEFEMEPDGLEERQHPPDLLVRCETDTDRAVRDVRVLQKMPHNGHDYRHSMAFPCH